MFSLALTPALLERTLTVNVHSVAFGIKHAARVLPRGGRIINTASFVGMIGVPGGAAYIRSPSASTGPLRPGTLRPTNRGGRRST